MPAQVEKRGSGTIVSPCPPSTNAVTFSTETSSASARKQRMRAESSTPAMPITRCFGKPERRSATWHIASSGLMTMIRIDSGERLDNFVDHFRNDLGVGLQQIVAAHARLARQSGGDDHDVGVFRAVVSIRSDQFHVEAFDRRGLGQVNALPCGTPSTMSTSTTSPSSLPPASERQSRRRCRRPPP